MKPRYFLMRHGDAGAHQKVDDDKRPLTPKGEEQVAKATRDLLDDGHEPTAVYFDPKTERTKRTAEIVGSMIGLHPEPDLRLSEGEHAKQCILDKAGKDECPVFVTHDHVIGALIGDKSGKDWPKKAEIRRYKGHKEKDRYKP